MLFHVRMDVCLPHALPQREVASLKAEEKARAQALQASGQWRHLWRIAGQYSNISLFDVASVEELHQLLSTLPLFPWMQIQVIPLCRHPSSVREDDR
ncbi:muconolactone Delta-isomerase [Erwinia persicina]|uniref:muconolactone Delta-isomerase n=1 Tax=Erwinia persicina TaxID=55211 RepID=UPI001785E137|nr:muconolactone Delta-isomerase [Erwinia persicina]MBD8164623.1 muconolactone Delta-isomerase [Erwinia persicina]